MQVISHRGNIKGPKPDKENRPSYIDCAIQLGYPVEVDIRFIKDKFWLGHDTPDYMVEPSWLLPRLDNLWLHCKNIEAVSSLYRLGRKVKLFCHSKDSFVLTSTGQLWVRDLFLPLDANCIIPLMTQEDIRTFPFYHSWDAIGSICTDYPEMVTQITNSICK